ncbi:hypothetical protein HDV00_009553, partial [Rhizophlyctis rosea]
MALTIVGLLLRPVVNNGGGNVAQTGTEKVVQTAAAKASSPIPNFPKKTQTFLPDEHMLSDDMFKSGDDTRRKLHNWIPLSTRARGYVQIPDYKSYDLLEPYIVPVNYTSDGPAYMMSVFHQLHCLSYLVEHFQAGYGGTALEDEVAHHAVHCFDYIRQSLMCNADTSLEGKNGDIEHG